MNKITNVEKQELEEKRFKAKQKCKEIFPMLNLLKKECRKWDTLYTRYYLQFSNAGRILAESKVIKLKSHESKTRKFNLDSIDNLSKEQATELIASLTTRLRKSS